MSLEKINSIGTIKINDYVFARIVLDSLRKAGDKVFPASEKGKLIGGLNQKVSTGEMAANISITESDGECTIRFFLILTFGASISEVTKEILDYIEYEMKGLMPFEKGQIILKIVGTKSKKIAPRNIEIVRKYESSK